MGHGNKSFEKDLINRERDLQRQQEKERIDRIDIFYYIKI